MSKIFKSILWGSFGLFLVAGLFLLPELLGKNTEVKASFGACAPIYLDNTSKVATDVYQAPNEVTWTGPLIKITPTHSTANNFNVSYSQDTALSQSLSCGWQGGTWGWPTDSDLVCQGNSFMAGMQWKQDTRGENKRKIYCCSDNVSGIVSDSSIWEVHYTYTAGADMAADCSKDAAGVPKPGGVIVGLKNSGNPDANASIAVCRQFSRSPLDLRVTVFCGDLGVYGTAAYPGHIQCTGNIKNYGCDLTANVSYDSSQGLGSIFYYNVTNAEGKVIGQGVTLDDVVSDSEGWESGRRRCESNVVGNSVNSGTGQNSSCTFSSLRDEEYFITFCARGKAGSAGGEAPGNLSNNCDTVRVIANKPNLVVEEVSCSGCTRGGEYYFVTPGAPFTLRAVVKNQGQAASGLIAESGRGVTFSVGSSEVPDVAFGLAALNPGATVNRDPSGNSLQYTFNFPTSFLGEKWQDYKICVDPPGALGGGGYYDRYGDILESGGTTYSNDNDASNCKIFRASASLPNLVVHTFESLALVPVGVTQNLKVIVENIGATASGQTTVRVYKDFPAPQEKICEFSLPGLGAAGSSNAVSQNLLCPFVFSQKTTYNFRVVIDEDNLVGEISENDNGYGLTVRADYPDFTVPELTCYPGTPTSPGTAGAVLTNENFFCRAKIQNTGRAPILENLDYGITFYAMGSSTETPINRCTATLIADDVKPGDPGQQVQCAFSSSPATPALAMQQIKVCVDPDNKVSESADTEASNCKTQALNFQLPDLEPQGFTCKYSTGGTSWSNCMPGLSGSGLDWRVTDGANLKFASKAKNTSTFNMSSRTLTKGMVYYFDGQEKCNFNLAPLPAGQMSDFIPQSEAEWCGLQNVNHLQHSGAHRLKACADPKGSTAFGELFEGDDTDQDNCLEKSVAIASPDLKATLECPATVSKDTPFTCTAAISNQTDIAMTQAIAAGQGVVYYLDGTEVSNCRFGLSALGAYGSYSQTCQFTFSDLKPHAIKVCADPKDGLPPYGVQFEEDDSNQSNCAETVVMVVVPDFVLDTYSFDCPDTIVRGQDFTCRVKAWNANTGANYTSPVAIAFLVNDVEASRTSQALTAQRLVVTSGPMQVGTIPESGVASVTVYIDPDNVVYENNAMGHDNAESNNRFTLENIPVVETLQPDFTVLNDSIRCYDEDLLVQVGQPFACEARIKNIGYTTSSSNFYTAFYSSWQANSFLGMDFVNINVVPLRPGQYHTVLPVNLTFDTPGDYPMVVCVDRSVSPPSNLNLAPVAAPGVVPETNETNNCLEGPTIKAVTQLLADLSIADTEAGCSAAAVALGEEFSCYATVRNIGHVDSPALQADSNGVKGVVMYIDGKPYAQALDALPAGTGSQQVSWDNLVIQDDGGTFPRDVTFEFCVDHPFPGNVPEYDDSSTIRNNCADFTLRVLLEDEPTAAMTLSANSIALGQSVEITVSASDTQGITKVGYNVCPTGAGCWKLYSCPEGSVTCENIWTYTPDWSGETRTIVGYARGLSLTGEPQAVWASADLTVLSGLGGGEVTFKAQDKSDPSRPISVAAAAITLYHSGTNEVVGICTTDSTGACAVNIEDWTKPYKLLVQTYGYLSFILDTYIPESFTQLISLTPTMEAEVPVRFAVVEAGAESTADPVEIVGADVTVLALAVQGDNQRVIGSFTCQTNLDGLCEFALRRLPEENESYSATISHADYLDAFFDFDIAVGSVGEAYQISLDRGAGTVEVTFKVINDETGAAVQGATVEVVGIDSRLTAADGKCLFDLVPAAGYDIRVRASGYNDFAWDGYIASAGEQPLGLVAVGPGGPRPVTGTINNASGGEVVNEVSAGVKFKVAVPPAALPAGVASVEVTVEPVRTTAMAAATAMSKVSKGLAVIGSYFYRLSATGGVAFSPPATISLTYTDGQVAAFNESALAIYYYDETSSEWKALATNVNAGANTATAQVSRFGLFGLLVPSCCDSDPGQDINSVGVVSYGLGAWQDECVNGNTVRQYVCDGVGFNPATNFGESSCLGLGCTEGVCRRADDRVGVIFQVIKAGTVNPVRGAKVFSRNVATGLEEGSCSTGDDGRCTIYLTIGARYNIKLEHRAGDYQARGYDDLGLTITPLEPIPPIEMVEIEKYTYTFTLKRGFNNFIPVPTKEPLRWADITAQGGCLSYTFRYFYMYSPTAGWITTTSEIPGGQVGYVPWGVGRDRPRETECLLYITGQRLATRSKTFERGSNMFIVTAPLSVADIQARCNVSTDTQGLRFAEAISAEGSTAGELYRRLGPGDTLVAWNKAYWIEVVDDCTVTW